MTRETKIGLLVGLAFIIVIGILLSDHLTSTTEPASAPLASVGAKTREGLTTLGRPSVSPVTIEPPPVVEPRRPVVTVDEMKKPTEVTDVIKLGPAPAPVQPVSPERRIAIIDQGRDTVPPTPTPNAGELTGLLQQHADELEVIDGRQATGSKPGPVVIPQDGQATAETDNQFREYKAREGDTLNKLAGRFLGKNTAANRDAIMRANPGLKGDPNRIVVGKTYLIPTMATTVANLPLPGGPTGPVAPQQARGTIVPAPSGTYWYTVKENDNLWKIAARELGDGNAWTAIKELNRDVLKGGEIVRENMRLRLPAKPGNATAAIE
jgi:phage tail protein X